VKARPHFIRDWHPKPIFSSQQHLTTSVHDITHPERFHDACARTEHVLPVMPKRSRDDLEVEDAMPSTLTRLRSMWQFANLAQYLALFGNAVRIDQDFDIEVRCGLRQRV